MSESPNSTPTEATADLSQNLDEALDLQLGLGALGGMRHSAACDAAEKSQRRYDDRNHRLHEARMKKLGMEGDETAEDEDMSQQVLIRSPVTHHHHHYDKPTEEPTEEPTVQPQEQAQPKQASKLATAALVAASVLGGGGLGAGIPWLLGAYDQPTPTSTTIHESQNLGVGVEVIPGGANNAD